MKHSQSFFKTKNTDVNILTIDANIHKILKKRKDDIPSFKDQLNSSKSVFEKNKIRQTIKDIENNSEYIFYVYKTEKIINRYKELKSKTQNKSFIKKKASDDEKLRNEEMKNLTIRFLSIARNYIPINNFEQTFMRQLCKACEKGEFIIDEESTYICNSCGSILDILDDSASFKDSERVNMCTKYEYTKKGHFIDALLKFQGKQNKIIPNKVYTIIDNEMNMSKLNIFNISKDQVRKILENENLNEYYDDLNLIYHKITGKDTPELSDYQEILTTMFLQFIEVFEILKDSTQINTMNINFILYKLLQLIGYPCCKDDFYILKTKTNEIEYDRQWEKYVRYLEDKYPQSIWRFIQTN